MRALLVLSVSALCACSTVQQQKNQAHVINDAYLTTAVATKLAVTNADSMRMVHVSVRDGVATLRGQASSLKEETQFVTTAKSVSGVHGVINRLTVNPHALGINQSATDAALTVKVSAAIAAQAGLNVFHVSPSVHNSVVTLTGTVPNHSVEETIVQTTAHLSGVSHVIDHLRVSR